MAEKSMVKSAFHLTFGTLISRIIGILYVFLFSRLVDPEGLALYSYAYIPYAIFLDLATLGIPTGITRYIAEQPEENKLRFSRYLYDRIKWVSFLLGLVMFFSLFLLSTPMAYAIIGGKDSGMNRVEDVSIVIKLISTALLIIPNLSLIRGIFNGLKQTRMTARSQVIEQVVRVSIILVSAYVFIQVFGRSYRPAIYVSVLAAVISGLFTFIVMFIRYNRLRGEEKTFHWEISTRKLIRQIFSYALPAVMITLLFGGFNLTDTLTFNLAFRLGGHPQSEIQYATYIFEVQKLINLPLAFGVSLGTSFMVHVKGKQIGQASVVKRQINHSLEMLLFVLMPIVILLMVFSREIYVLLFNGTVYGPKILFNAAPLILPMGILHVFSGVMQRLNREWAFIRRLLVGMAIKLVLNIPLIIYFGTDGAILSSFLGWFFPVVLNGREIIQSSYETRRFSLRRMVIIALISAVLGGIIGGMNQLVSFPSRNRIWLLFVLGGMSSLYLILYLWGCYTLGILDCLFGRTLNIREILHDKGILNDE